MVRQSFWRFSTRALAFALFALATPITSPAPLRAQAAATVTWGPYLQIGTPTSMTGRWRTSTAVVGRVHYGQSPGVVSGTVDESLARTEHEVRLSGLMPDTLYYSIGEPSGQIPADTSFPFQDVAGGGYPKAGPHLGVRRLGHRRRERARSARCFTGARGTHLWLMLGDNAYNDGLDQEYQAAIFDTYPAILRNTVLYPACGNHDGSASDSATQSGPFYDDFSLPKQGEAGGVRSGTEAYYSFDYASIHFIELESSSITRRTRRAPMIRIPKSSSSRCGRTRCRFSRISASISCSAATVTPSTMTMPNTEAGRGGRRFARPASDCGAACTGLRLVFLAAGTNGICNVNFLTVVP
jgi:hypothetical protein